MNKLFINFFYIYINNKIFLSQQFQPSKNSKPEKMDNEVQQTSITAQLQKPNVIKSTISLYNILYDCNYVVPTSVNAQSIVNKLNAKQFTMTKAGHKLTVKVLEGAISLDFIHCCGKRWVDVGKFNDIPEIFKTYPVTDYQFGVIYNGPMVMPIICNTWNRGYRITTRDTFPRGDDAKSMTPVRVMWTKGTDDAESKGGDWYHQYVNQEFKPYSSNGKQNPVLYAKKF